MSLLFYQTKCFYNMRILQPGKMQVFSFGALDLIQKLQSVNLFGKEQPVSRMNLLRGESVQFHNTFR